MAGPFSLPRHHIPPAAILAASFLLCLPAAARAAHHGDQSLDGQTFSCKADVVGSDKSEHHYDATVTFNGDTATLTFAGLRWTMLLFDSEIDDSRDIGGYFIDEDGSYFSIFLDCSDGGS